MGYDPEGTWSWGKFWDIFTTVVSVVVGVAVGIVVGVATKNVGFGVAAGVATTGAINNAVNFVYYTFISDGISDLNETSYSGTDGNAVNYLSRWDRLDYTKAMTKDSWYNLNAWRYYSEYSFHMYAWMVTSSFFTGNDGDGFLSDIAYRAYEADILKNEFDADPIICALTILFGMLGI